MKIKSILIIVATLIIGFIIGFLTNGQLTKQRFDRFVHQNSFDVFKVKMMDIIQPDADQVKDIEPLLDKYAQKTHESIEQSKESMKSIHESMMKELKPLLTEEQYNRLETSHKRFRNMMDRKRRPGPPPGADKPQRHRPQ